MRSCVHHVYTLSRATVDVGIAQAFPILPILKEIFILNFNFNQHLLGKEHYKILLLHMYLMQCVYNISQIFIFILHLVELTNLNNRNKCFMKCSSLGYVVSDVANGFHHFAHIISAIVQSGYFACRGILSGNRTLLC